MGDPIISCDSSDLLEDVKQDILEFGPQKIVAVWMEEYEGEYLITNYDFINLEDPIFEDEECFEKEHIEHLTLEELRSMLEKQSRLFG